MAHWPERNEIKSHGVLQRTERQKWFQFLFTKISFWHKDAYKPVSELYPGLAKPRSNMSEEPAALGGKLRQARDRYKHLRQ